MKIATIAFAILSAMCAIEESAATPAPRAAVPSIKASKIKSFALWGWGPLEKSADGDDLVILDGDLESAATIKKLKSQGKTVACYMSAGTVENWRSDAGKFSSDDMAKKYKGFGGTETWLDVTQWQDLKKPMGDRLKRYADKGCMAVEFDNIDCYNNMCVAGASASTLRKKEIEYVSWLADTAHGYGMAAGMKNAGDLIDSLIGKMQFAVNEECQDWNECGQYKKFTAQDKLVVGVEYNDNGGKVCQVAKQNNMLTKYKSGGKWQDCF